MTYRTTSNVTFLELPELICVRARLIHLSKGNIHEVVAIDQVPVKSLAILKFYELR